MSLISADPSRWKVPLRSKCFQKGFFFMVGNILYVLKVHHSYRDLDYIESNWRQGFGRVDLKPRQTKSFCHRLMKLFQYHPNRLA
jgi:hypothetical protein